MQLRPPVNQRELEVDPRTGMKVSAEPTCDGIRIDMITLRTTWPLRMGVGILQPRSSAAPSATASRKVAAPGAGMALSFGKLTGSLDRVSIPLRTSPLTATGSSLLCVSLVTTKSSVTLATTVGVLNEHLDSGKLTFSF